MRSQTTCSECPAARRPPGDHRDDDLGHEADEALDLEDVQATGTRGVVHGRLVVGVLVAVAAADALVAAGAERPAAVLRTRTVARQQHRADAGVLPCVIERAVELVDGVRAEGVAHLWAVERDTGDSAVRADVGGDVGVVLGTGREHPFVRVEQV
ncbi:hypothetical protein QE375_000119 [Microbacterium foliorum]|uniref:Uncharacterized protein n=1 Tax=Microbacterium foliorum TaxID=104336 RepID=A0ABU1HN78_9MICO|nr:hypothetical protein [Microbacterium foliorum]